MTSAEKHGSCNTACTTVSLCISTCRAWAEELAMQSVHVTGREAGAEPGFWAQKVSTCVVHAAHISAANRLASNRLAVARAVGGGGGGTSDYVHIGYVSSLNRFQPYISAPEQIIFTSNIKSTPGVDFMLWTRASPFYSFCRSRDHHFQHLLSSTSFVVAHGQFTAASPNTKRLASAPGL